MERAGAIGQLFIKTKDVKSSSAWNLKHLGIEFGDNSYIGSPWK